MGILGLSTFIGKSLRERLWSQGHNVVSFVRNPDSHSEEFGRQVKFDFEKIDEVSEELASLDTVIHLVSSGTPASSNQSHYRSLTRGNQLATRRLVEILGTSGTKKLIFASSGGAVYGSSSDPGTTESQQTSPVSMYGKEKRALEQEILESGKAEGLDRVILRIANPYGPEQKFKRGQGLVPMIIHCALENKAVPVRGTGMTLRDYIYIDDLIEAFQASMNHKGSSLLNIGSGKGHTVLDVISLLEDIMKVKIKIDFVAPSNSDVSSIVLDSRLAEKTLGWKTSTDFITGLESTVKWYLNYMNQK